MDRSERLALEAELVLDDLRSIKPLAVYAGLRGLSADRLEVIGAAFREALVAAVGS